MIARVPLGVRPIDLAKQIIQRLTGLASSADSL
jgi:hypothetical protein